MLTIRLNHDTQLFRVILDGRTLGRFETVWRLGGWWVFATPHGQTIYVHGG